MSFPQNAEDWPRPFRQLVLKHGAQRVHLAGVKALSYPPAWAHSQAEFLAVAKEFTH